MEKPQKKLIEQMAVERNARGISLRELSKQTGVSFATLSRLERRETEPDSGTLARVAAWLQSNSKNVSPKIEQVAEVHFRAAKNVESHVAQALAKLAIFVREKYK